tara:strand:- start:69 stop:329 length:261 start_codon:yes stop_codon:yes gene_type:complete
MINAGVIIKAYSTMVGAMDYRDKQSEAFRWAHAILKHLDHSTSLEKVSQLAHFLLKVEQDQTTSHSNPSIVWTLSQKSLVDELNEA